MRGFTSKRSTSITTGTRVYYSWAIIAILSARISAFHTTTTRSSFISSMRQNNICPTSKSKPKSIPHTIAFATTDNKNSEISDAQKLLDKAAQLRAEIAVAEGKTLEEVQDEAKAKKRDEILRQEKRREESAAAKQKRLEDNAFIKDGDNSGRFVQVPVTFDDMVRQAARAVERAFQDGKTRQTVRFNLVGEEEGATEENEFPGGSKQMYRESGRPLTDALLREVRAPTKNVDTFPDNRRINPDLKVRDIWDFDGTALHTAEAAEGPSADIQAMVFPNTDNKYLEDIDKISEETGSRLFMLVNPFWRNVESWGFNILAPGAKKRAQEVIFGKNAFEETYSMMLFSVRGEKCVALKAYPYDWQLFAFREDDYYQNEEYVIRLGSCKDSPSSSHITGLLNERPEFKETKTMRQMKKLGGN